MHTHFTALLVAAAASEMSFRADAAVAHNVSTWNVSINDNANDARVLPNVLADVLAHFRDHGVLTKDQYERGLAHGRHVQAYAKDERWAVVTYLGGNGVGAETHGYMYGVYSVKARMKALGMSPRVDQVVFYNHATPKKYVEILEGWLGPENVIFTNIENDLAAFLKEAKSRELWAGVFSKLVFFNLTRYDRLITLDNDVLIRQNIEHWFWDYPPPLLLRMHAPRWNGIVGQWLSNRANTCSNS